MFRKEFTAESAEIAELEKIQGPCLKLIAHISKSNVPTPKIWKLEFRIWYLKIHFFSPFSACSAVKMKGECHETG